MHNLRAKLPDPCVNVAVNCVLFGFDDLGLQILLVHRRDRSKPHFGKWCLPGGLVQAKESLQDALTRTVYDETSLNLKRLDEPLVEPFKVYDDIGRDPRGRVICIAYFGLLAADPSSLRMPDDEQQVVWRKMPKDLAYPISKEGFAFDHSRIINEAVEQLRRYVRHRPVGMKLLGNKFTMGELRYLYECILGERLNPSNFRTALLSKLKDYNGNELLKPSSDPPRKSKFWDPKRPNSEPVLRQDAPVYEFDVSLYKKLRGQGFAFELPTGRSYTHSLKTLSDD